MKKIKYLLILVLLMVFMPKVYAASVSTSLTGTNTIKVGNTTTIYVKLNSSGGIRGVDLTYSTSGNISVVSAVTAGGLTEQSRNGNRVLSYSSSDVASGTSVFAITVKGTAVGTGTVTVSNLKATVSGETATGNNASITITVNPQKTQAEIEAEKKKAEEQKKLEEEKKKKEEEENKIALSKATLLVETAESSLKDSDYDSALEAVNALVDSEDKTKLLERLDEVKFNSAVKKECNSCKCDAKVIKEKDKSDSKKWIILNVVLILLSITEFIYIVATRKKED